MTGPSLVILAFVGILIGSGVYLALERTLSRIFIGLSLITNGVNLLILAMGGAAGLPPLLGRDGSVIVDPLPQAMILTSIVLSLGTTAFGLALAYRSWLLTGNDEVADDVEDRRLSRLLGKRASAVDDSFAEGTEDRTVFYDRDDVPHLERPSPSEIRRLRAELLGDEDASRSEGDNS
ncbi:MAG: Na(+)/H(+) antiporter subunit C [Scrofimicrobium sp.]